MTDNNDAGVTNNIVSLFKQDNQGYVVLTSFDGGDTPKDFLENYNSALQKIITMDEYQNIHESGEKIYIPHAVFGSSKTPDCWVSFVDNDLEKFVVGVTDRTYVIVRCFEVEDEQYVPVHVDVEGHVQMPQMTKPVVPQQLVRMWEDAKN